MTFRHLIYASMLVSLLGCSTATGSAAKRTQSGFDGSRIISIAGHATDCQAMRCTGLGAYWTSDNPTMARLTVHLFNDTKGITSAKLNIDGRFYALAGDWQLTQFHELGSATEESRKNFPVPLSLIRDLVKAKHAWLRVDTPSGYAENAIIDGDEDSKAHNALKRFLAAVDAP